VRAHVGLNLVFLVPGETGGMETAARELIPELVAQAPEASFTAFVNREAAALGGEPWGELVPAVTVPVRARNRIGWVRGEQLLLPRLARRAGVDVLHSLGSTSPAWGAFRRVTTVHDLNYRVVPEAHFGVRGLGMRMLVPLSARRSHRLVAVSRSTASDLVRLLGVPREKIDVVPWGVGSRATEAPAPEAELRARLRLGDRPVVLTVSAKRPHKNLARLLAACAAFEPATRPILVLPGYATPYEAELRRMANELGVDGDVRFTGWLSAAELEGLYRAAAAFVFPSLYEGFGLPVLEAMARGVPVACSNRASLPEVAGTAALMFDPESPPAIADAMKTLLTDQAAAARLRAAGRERAARFTWEAAARATLASYERTLASA
jgi:glycosyltransferase involved in cell wall biosynthesis